MRRCPVLFATLALTMAATSCSASKPVQQSAQTIATEADPIIETSAPPAETIATTIEDQTTTTTTTAAPAPSTTTPAPNSEAALRQRVIEAQKAFVDDQLHMPETDFASSKSFFISEAQANFTLKGAIEQAKSGSGIRLSKNPINEFVITKIERSSSDENSVSLVSVCNIENLVKVNPGPDAALDTADDEVLSSKLITSVRVEKWTWIEGQWKKAAVLSGSRSEGRSPCAS
jgi:hypothetical protein